MIVFALAHSGLFKDLVVTTHPHVEAARQFLTLRGVTSGPGADMVVIGPDDLEAVSSPKLAVLFNQLVTEDRQVAKFETKPKAQARVFAALEAKYGSQEHEPFNPVESATGLTANPTADDHKEDSSEGSNSNEEAPMAAKSKKKVVKKKAAKKPAGERKPRASAPLYEELATSQPKSGMTCGCYIRSLLMKGGKTTETIIELVKKYFPESSAKNSDVSWNRGRLKAAGKKLPE